MLIHWKCNNHKYLFQFKQLGCRAGFVGPELYCQNFDAPVGPSVTPSIMRNPTALAPFSQMRFLSIKDLPADCLTNQLFCTIANTMPCLQIFMLKLERNIGFSTWPTSSGLNYFLRHSSRLEMLSLDPFHTFAHKIEHLPESLKHLEAGGRYWPDWARVAARDCPQIAAFDMAHVFEVHSAQSSFFNDLEKMTK